ncbi:MAG: universal stress protein [Candidatus Marinimicrobia bacterium]|jgi:nucleotide-binding universal stress UspA family protein|nr:universal stress protein [Candidatus Neomarinimicrobiota bacterium]MBT3675553.1 universal stress protein [Candidatus Neomarinimicrobiota bacterium]MBT3762482.1 universal stress protein [Candidatus Neomarinimicrobiota bacterium]MBT4067631.1 universal stress protein [Candidatus Neomarinimicrobiota bacterium]MBT4271417.1 universal stress protein [Candidatus Neomarinimicrobiota bacterium]
MGYKNILVGLCGRGDEKKVIEVGIKMAKDGGGKLTFIHVNEPHAGEMSMMMDAPPPKFSESDIYERVSAVNETSANDCTITIISSDSIPRTISKAALGHDILILGHRKQNYFKKNFFDSIDEGILNKANCPVLVVPK